VTRYLLIAVAVIYAMTEIAGGPDRINVLVAFGANGRAFVAAGELWRLVASMFLHGNLLHLILNGYALFLLGSNLEAFYGPWRFLFLYLVSGVVASIASAVFAEVVSVGASGGIFGLLGASIVFAYKYRRILPRRVTRIMGTALLPWVAINVVLGFVVPHIDMNAHLGGMLAGAVIALFLTPHSLLAALGRDDTETPRALAAVCLALLVMSFVGAAASVLRTRGPDGPNLPSWQYEALAQMERPPTRELLDERLEKAPESVPLRIVRAELRTLDGDWEGAVADYRKALELGPPDAQVLNNLAWLLLEEAPEPIRDRREAAELAARALKLAPDDPYVLGTYGTARLRAGEAEDAVRFLRKAVDREPDRPGEGTDRYLLAIALARSGRPADAREELARAVRQAPDDPYRAEAEDAIQSAPAP
jgi:membrane associated rhomboid family serine protease/Tfp pilus assembly protein PilF